MKNIVQTWFRKHLALAIGGVLLLSSCYVKEAAPTNVEGYRPIYKSISQVQQIETMAAQPLKQPGKIYVKDTYLFVNEYNKGIHIINNQDPVNPKRVAFISIPGNVDIAVKGSTLYADNYTDMVALDISNPASVKVLKRIEGAFPIQAYPPYTGVYFECVSSDKGVVIGWEKTTLTDPKCRR
ncbi:MAG: hypothetical protein U0Y10_10015 [Spirosomataceae bacterium]